MVDPLCAGHELKRYQIDDSGSELTAPDSSHRLDSLSQPAWLVQAIRLLMLAGVGLGLFSVWSRYFIFTDGTVYAVLAKNLVEGKGLDYCGATHLFYPPGYPFAIALLYLGFQDAELAGHLVSFFAYLGSIFLTVRLAWAMRPSPVFLLAATGMVVFHPYFILYSSSVMSESLFVCVVLAGAYCTWILANREHSPLWLWCIWGVVGGFAYLIRADGIVYWFLQAFYIFVFSPRSFRYWIPGGIMAAALMVLTILPYLILIHRETGQWQLSTKTPILLEFSRMKMNDGSARGETRQTSTLSDDGTTFAIDRAQETLGEFLTRHPHEAFQRMLWNAERLIRRTDIVFSWLILPVLTALAAILRKRVLSRKSLFLMFHVSPILLFSLFYIDERFILTFIPFFAMAHARVLEWTFDFYNRFPRKMVWNAILIAAVILAAVLGFHYGSRIKKMANRVVPSNLPLEHKYLGLWMRDRLSISPGIRISHRNPWVSFYAGGCHVRTPDFDIHLPETERAQRLVQWCRDRGVLYLIVDERMTLPTMPGLAFLLEDHLKFDGLIHKKTIAGSFPKIVLYQIAR